MTAKHRLRERLPYLAEAYRILRYPKLEGTIWRDVAITRKRALSLFPHRRAMSAHNLLILMSTNSVYETKLLAILAAELQIRGLSPYVIRPMRDPIFVEGYFRGLNMRQFINMNSVSYDTIRARNLARRFQHVPGQGRSTTDIKEYRDSGVNIGLHALAAISRRHHIGSVDTSTDAAQAEIDAEIRRIADQTVKAEAVIAAVRPKLGLCVESKGTFVGPVVETMLARGIAVVQVTQPWRDDALMCKRFTESSRVHPSSVSTQTLRQLYREGWTVEKEASLKAEFARRYSDEWVIQRRNQPRSAPSERIPIGLINRRRGKPLIVLFSHVLWDANLYYGEDLFDDYGHWFVETLRVAAHNRAVDWVVKLHPAAAWKLAAEGLRGPSEEMRLISQTLGDVPSHMTVLHPGASVSTLALYREADAGITVRGTPGMEMPCFGKVVFTAGTGRYSGLGFTVDSESRDEYLNRLASIRSIPPLSPDRVILAKQHAYGVFCRRPWFMKSIEPIFKPAHGSPLDQNLRFTVTTRAELETNADLASWAQWAAESEEPDYVNESS